MSGPCPFLFIAQRSGPAGPYRAIPFVNVVELLDSLRGWWLVLLATMAEHVQEAVRHLCFDRRAAGGWGARLRRRQQPVVVECMLSRRYLGLLRQSLAQQTCGLSLPAGEACLATRRSRCRAGHTSRVSRL